MKRWLHKAIAKTYDVPEDVVRRIYGAVQTAKKQGLHGGYYADLSERSVGRKLVGAEYTVSAEAKKYLGYDPPGGYGGPVPKGAAEEPARDPKNKKLGAAGELRDHANRIIRDALKRWGSHGFSAEDRALLRTAADEFDAAADLFEEAGYGVAAGTLRERAKYAREGKHYLLSIYD